MTSAIAQAEHAAAQARTKSVDELVADKKAAQRALSAALNVKRSDDTVTRLKAAVKTIQQAEAKARIRAQAESSTLDQVLAARAVPLDTNELLKNALANELIPADLRAELPAAMEKVQAVSPHAPGISVENVAGLELGRTSRGHGGTVWASTVSGRGHVHGYAYEIVAASRFIDQAKAPGSGGRPVEIVQGADELVFGQKLPTAGGRRSVEADILVVKGGGHKIGIDAKNYSSSFPASADFRGELDGIKEAIRQGEVHEFHFAVRGAISPGAKEAIQQADLELRMEMRNASPNANPTISELQARSVDLSQPVICWHEHLG